MEGARASRRRSRSNSSSSSSGDDDRADAWDISKVNEVKEMCEEEESYLNSFYRDCFAELVFPFGHSHMRTEKFIEVLARENFSWVFDPEQLRGRFMNMARAPAGFTTSGATPGVIISSEGEDLAAQVRNARHVVEQDRRIVHASSGARVRANSSSSSSSRGSGNKVILRESSQEGGAAHTEYIRREPARTIYAGGSSHGHGGTTWANTSARVSRVHGHGTTTLGSTHHGSSSHAVRKRVVISPGGTRREVDAHGDGGAVERFGDAWGHRYGHNLDTHVVNTSNVHHLNTSHHSTGRKTVQYTDLSGHTNVRTVGDVVGHGVRDTYQNALNSSSSYNRSGAPNSNCRIRLTI